MATRMQQRRGTAAQWTSTNDGDGPILEVGEIGFETDTGKFKIGDGTNRWIDLDYFLDESEIDSITGDYVLSSTLGQNNGVATLDGSGKLTSSQIPNIDELSQEAVNNALIAGSGLDKTYDDLNNTITLDIDSTVTVNDAVQTLTNKTLTSPKINEDVALTATATELNVLDGITASTTELNYVDGVTSAIQTQLDDKLSKTGGTMTGDITLPGSPTQALHAATKAYVDSLGEGLHIHASCVAATTANVSIATDLEAGDIVDGVTLAENDRVLVKSQTNAAQNGIYVVQASGAALRASDFNEPQEVDGGDFVFVTGGTLYDNTGWVQTTTNVVTIGTDPIAFTQFSGAGTYTAGSGLELNGTVFSIDTDTTVDTSTIQTLTNKTIDASSNTLSNISNASLTNSSVTINGETVSLGGSVTISAAPTPQAVSSNITMVANYNYFVDTTAARNLTLPASPALGDTIAIYDASGSAATNNITISRNGNKINGLTEDALIDVDQSVAVIVYTGATLGWKFD
jgi:hypothetical protein